MSGPSKTKTVKAMQAIGFVWEVLIAIALPTTLFALAGRWADQRWGTSPWMAVIGLLLALGTTYVLMKRKIQDYKEIF